MTVNFWLSIWTALLFIIPIIIIKILLLKLLIEVLTQSQKTKELPEDDPHTTSEKVTDTENP